MMTSCRYQQFYMYNVTNPDEFAKGSKPMWVAPPTQRMAEEAY